MDLLGFEETAKPEGLVGRGGVWFRRGSAEIHVGVEDSFAPAKKAHVALLVEDLDGVAAKLGEAGYPTAWDDLYTGYRRVYTVDPYGNRIELLSPTS